MLPSLKDLHNAGGGAFNAGEQSRRTDYFLIAPQARAKNNGKVAPVVLLLAVVLIGSIAVGVTYPGAGEPERSSGQAPELESGQAPERSSGQAPDPESGQAPEPESGQAPELERSPPPSPSPPPQDFPSSTGGTVRRLVAATSRRNLESGGARSVASFIMWPQLPGFELVSRLINGVDCAISYAATKTPSSGGLVQCYVPQKGFIAMTGSVTHEPYAPGRWGTTQMTIKNYAGEEDLAASILVNATVLQPISTTHLCSDQGGFVAYAPQPGLRVHVNVPTLSLEAEVVYHETPTDSVGSSAFPDGSSWSSLHVRIRECDVRSYISEDRARSMMAVTTNVSGSKCGEHREHAVLGISGSAQWQSLQGLKYLGLTSDGRRTEYAVDGRGVTKWVVQYRVNGVSPTTIPRLTRATVMFNLDTDANERGAFTPSLPMEKSAGFASTIVFGKLEDLHHKLKVDGQVFRSSTGFTTRVKASDHIIMRAQGLGPCSEDDPRLSSGLFARVDGACYLFVEYVSTLDDRSMSLFRNDSSVTVNLTHAASWAAFSPPVGDYDWDQPEVVLGSVTAGKQLGENGYDFLVAKHYNATSGDSFKLFYWSEQGREYAPPPVVCIDRADETMYVVSQNRWSLLMPGEGIKFASAYTPPLDPYNISGVSDYNQQEEPVMHSVAACVPIETAHATTTLRYEPLYVEVLPKREASVARHTDEELLRHGAAEKCDVTGSSDGQPTLPLGGWVGG